jgi:ribose 5-phosphate isomerase A
MRVILAELFTQAPNNSLVKKSENLHNLSLMSLEEAKKAAAHTAADFIEDGMLVGLGTGTTAALFIEKLSERCKKGLSIKAVASSNASAALALKGGIPLLDIDKVTMLDITVDGADEIDPQKRMIKGGGGASVREKIVAAMSREMVVIIDEKKLVYRLGTHKLPVEVLPFAHQATALHLKKIGYHGGWRKNSQGSIFITDNNNYIFDVQFSEPCEHPEKEHDLIRGIPGVIETGFFFNLAGRVVIGFLDGQIVTQS